MRTVGMVVAVVLAACGGRIEAEQVVGTVTAANPCGAPDFALGECVDDVLNDGGGPDDRRRVCKVGADTWVLYPSGEQWHWRERDGSSPEVICHAGNDAG